MSIVSHEVKTVCEYLSIIGSFEQQHVAQWIYRGHCDADYRLVPSLFRIDRAESFASWDDLEEYLLESFKREARGYLPQMLSNDLEWTTLAQHHGLPMRLLDWTTNPLIALFFAVEDEESKNADVWCLGLASTNNCLPSSTRFARWISIRKSGMICYPSHISPRISNQGGCFTIHKDPRPLEEILTDESFCTYHRIRVDSRCKTDIADELFALDIHQGFIYPGLDGLAGRLKFEVTAQHKRHTNYDYGSNVVGIADVSRNTPGNDPTDNS